jgi:hypothetical protein
MLRPDQQLSSVSIFHAANEKWVQKRAAHPFLRR